MLTGNEAIAVVRGMLGRDQRAAAAPGTVRGDYSISKQNNLIHGSDSPESARAARLGFGFANEELVDYELAGDEWVLGGS